MVDLGVFITVFDDGITLLPPQDKREKWASLIQSILDHDELHPQLAGSLAGKLSWSCTSMWNRCGRVFIRCLFKRQTEHTHVLTNEIRDALLWWLKVLPNWPAAHLPWTPPHYNVSHLYVDASLKHQTIAWIFSAPQASLLWSRCSIAIAEPAPIFYWELLAAIHGFLCNASRAKNSTLILWTDNSAVFHALRRNNYDTRTNEFVCRVWDVCLTLHINLWIEHIPGNRNPAHFPANHLYYPDFLPAQFVTNPASSDMHVFLSRCTHV